MATAQDVLEAVGSGDAAGLRQLLGADATLSQARDAAGVSAVMMACYYRRFDLAGLLLEHRDPDAFEAAALGRQERLADLVAEDPAVATAWSADGFTALHFAAFLGHPGCAQVLLNAGADAAAVARNAMRVMPLHSSVAAGHQLIAELLLAAGSPVNERQAGGWTPLQQAAQHGDVDLVRLLLANGADPALAADDGRTAQSLAAAGGFDEVLALL